MEELDLAENSTGLRSVDLGEGIDYDFVSSGNSDLDWDSDNLEQVRKSTFIFSKFSQEILLQERQTEAKRRKRNESEGSQIQGNGPKYQLRACFFAKNFKGQRNGDNVGASQIAVNTVQEAVEALWMYGLKFIHYEAIISASEDGIDASSISFKDSKPTLSEIDKFLMVSDTVSKRYFTPSIINAKLLRGWVNREIHVMVYRYLFFSFFLKLLYRFNRF